MKIAIRYYSKTGHTKKMAQIVSEVVGVNAETIEKPIDEEVDVLLLGSSVYATVTDWRVKNFIKATDPKKVENVICFGSAGIIESPYPGLSAYLRKYGFHVDEREFHCRGQFTLLHRGHPDKTDLANLRSFVEGLQLENAAPND